MLSAPFGLADVALTHEGNLYYNIRHVKSIITKSEPPARDTISTISLQPHNVSS